MRAMAARLLALAVTLACASAANAQELCQAVAERLRTIQSPAGGGNLWLSLLEILAKQHDTVVQLSESRRFNRGELKDVIEREFHPFSDLLTSLTQFAQYPYDWEELARFGQSDLHIAIGTGGTMHCQAFVFFIAREGQAIPIGPPPIISENTSNLPVACSGVGSIAFAGAVGGAPAFFVERGLGSLQKDIVVTPWDGQYWQQRCTVSADYKPVFLVAGQFCKDLDCAKVGEQVRTLITQYDKNAKPFVRVDEQLQQKFMGRERLPTFGQDQNNPWLDFDTGSDGLKVTLDGRDYIARVGHAAIGWRISSNYIVALYRVAGNQLDPVAGFEIAKGRGELSDMTVRLK